MDNGKGTFDSITGSHYKELLEEALHTENKSRIDKIFSIEETVQIKQSKFKILGINHHLGEMTLKLLPDKKF
jgi:hypothetical protein